MECFFFVCRIFALLFLLVLHFPLLNCASHVVHHSACQAVINRRIIDLQSLQRTDGQPRFKVEYNGWNFTFNPCIAFNYPENPSKALGDQCHYVAMCKSRLTAEGEECYAVGLQRTAKFRTPSIQGKKNNSSEESEESSEESSEEGGVSSSEEEGIRNSTDSSEEEFDGGEDFEEDEDSQRKRREAVQAVDSMTNISSSTTHDSKSGSVIISSNTTTHEPPHRKVPPRRDPFRVLPPRRPRIHKMINTTFLIFRGESRVNPDDALFRPVPLLYLPHLVFELHHHCCCPDACAFNDRWPFRNATVNLDGSTEVEASEGPRYIWLIFVINLAVLVTAICIGAMCCRKGGASPSTTSPYSYLPALHSSHLTLHSMETTHLHSSNKMHVNTAEYLDYSSNLIKSQNLPKLSNCVIPSHSLEIGQRLGGGVFGDTYLADWKDRRVAAKRITAGIHSNVTHSEMEKYIISQTIMLSKQRHKHLVSVLGVCTDLRQPYILTEFVDGDTLKDLLFRQGDHAVKMSKRIKVCIQAADGMAFLHSAKPPILHRDLRAANILVDSNERAKVVDYGMAKITQRLRNECSVKKCFCAKETSALPAFIRWSAPEILQSPTATEANFDVFSPSVDVYSFGMVLWEVVSITDPFEEIPEDSEVKNIVSRGGRPRYDLLQNLCPVYIDLMCSCWDQNPDMRPTFKKCAVQLKTILHLFNKRSKSVVDNYSLRGSLPNLAASSEKIQRKRAQTPFFTKSSAYESS